MTHNEKVTHLIEALKSKGVSAYTTAPPIYRLAWALGLRIPPPLFHSFAGLAVGTGSLFAVGWGLIMPLLGSPQPVIAWVFAGGLFGLTMASYFRWKARKLKLPRHWGEYPPGQTCSACQAQNQADAKSCHACGQPMA